MTNLLAGNIFTKTATSNRIGFANAHSLTRQIGRVITDFGPITQARAQIIKTLADSDEFETRRYSAGDCLQLNRPIPVGCTRDVSLTNSREHLPWPSEPAQIGQL